MKLDAANQTMTTKKILPAMCMFLPSIIIPLVVASAMYHAQNSVLGASFVKNTIMSLTASTIIKRTLSIADILDELVKSSSTFSLGSYALDGSV